MSFPKMDSHQEYFVVDKGIPWPKLVQPAQSTTQPTHPTSHLAPTHPTSHLAPPPPPSWAPHKRRSHPRAKRTPPGRAPATEGAPHSMRETWGVPFLFWFLRLGTWSLLLTPLKNGGITKIKGSWAHFQRVMVRYSFFSGVGGRVAREMGCFVGVI